MVIMASTSRSMVSVPSRTACSKLGARSRAFLWMRCALNRMGCQRVLDLVSHALGRLLPGGDALGPGERADVFEDDEVAEDLAEGVAERRGRH